MATGYTIDGDSIRRLRSLLAWWKVQPQNVGQYDSDSGQPSEPPTTTFYNGTGAEVPAYGVMAITNAAAFDSGLIPYLKIAKPSATYAKTYAVNGPLAVADKAYGQCYASGACQVLYDDASNTPAADELWGPEPGQWYLTKGASDSGWGIIVEGISNTAAKRLLGLVLLQDGQLHWGKVQATQATFANADATAVQDVSVKACDSAGTLLDATAAAFDVGTPIRANKATALFTDYIVGYLTDYNGDKFIVTDCFDDKMKTVKQWDDVLGNIPDGWSELTAAIGKFIIGVDATGYHDLDATGGAFVHSHTHTKLGAVPTLLPTPGLQCIALDDHVDTDHTPPFLGLYNIIRDH